MSEHPATPARTPQTIMWEISWAVPDGNGEIDFLDEAVSHCHAYRDRDTAIQEMQGNDRIPPGAYLVKVTYERDPEGPVKPVEQHEMKGDAS